jgi:hypothetical protein
MGHEISTATSNEPGLEDRDSMIGHWIGASAGRLRSVAENRGTSIGTVWLARGERRSSVTIVRWRVNAGQKMGSVAVMPRVYS